MWVDQVTGRLLLGQRAMFYADGAFRVRDTTVFRRLKRVARPPQEVLQLLHQMIVP